MMRRTIPIFLLLMLIVTALGMGASGAAAQDAAEGTFLRVLQLSNDATAVSMTLQDGRPVLVNFTPNSVSEYFPYLSNRSSALTFVVAPPNAAAYTRNWTLPPLAPGYYTAALIGTGGDNTLDLILLDENRLCMEAAEDESCLIVVNNLKNSPALTVNIDGIGLIANILYRQAAVANAEAGGYRQLTVVDPPTPQNPVLRLEQGFLEPNVITLLTLSGVYSGGQVTNLQVGEIHRVPVDILTFLRGLTADMQVTDGETLYATENIVALLDLARFDVLFTNPNFPLTVFAPTDAAILAVAPAVFECATENPSAMRALIFNHILLGAYPPDQLVTEGALPAISGSTHTFRSVPGGILIDDTVTVPEDVHYSALNGDVYLIDSVLIPPNFQETYCTLG
ncbi:MAG: fasciclin domain-containing protein [Chloroflexi bacterium]|nr:fasciclin domain-containing protein [Chloroflexota bacterium]